MVVTLRNYLNHFRYKLLQNENAQLRQQRTPPVSVGGMDDSQLVQELNHKNRLIEIIHAQLKEYADNLDKEKRRAEMLTRETQQLQQQLQYGNHPPSVPPRAPTNMVIACLIIHDHLNFCL